MAKEKNKETPAEQLPGPSIEDLINELSEHEKNINKVLDQLHVEHKLKIQINESRNINHAVQLNMDVLQKIY
ncbi:hypothetical protein [Acinetobacter sp.]|uniref:hypothetical protein n=1 Tax=Acinetobacter sp. TaxID=472 RepID=UPI003D04D0CC